MDSVNGKIVRWVERIINTCQFQARKGIKMGEGLQSYH